VLLAVALSIYLGGLLGSMAWGFLCGAGCFLLGWLAFHVVWRGWLRDRITLTVINALHEPD
jgi:hypothetical protein